MINSQASPYECIGVKLYTKKDLYSDEEQYTGRGIIRNARIELSSKRVTTARARFPERTIELIVNSAGLTKAERKIKRKLVAERIVVPSNLRELMTSYYKRQDNKQTPEEKKE